MDPRHKALLRKYRLWLSEQLLVSDTIVPFLYQEDILTESQVEAIEGQASNKHRALKLLDILPSRGPRALDVFLRSLDEFSWVREQLQRDLQALPEPPSADEVFLPHDILHKVPSDRELCRIASLLGEQWETVLLDLDLTTEDLYRCRADNHNHVHSAALAGLVQWRRAQGQKATFQRLIESFKAADIHPSLLRDVLG